MQFRERAGFNHRTAAARLKISPATVLRLEKGKNWANLSTLAAMADLYGVQVRDFLEPGPMPEPDSTALLRKLLSLVVALDYDGLQAMVELATSLLPPGDSE